MVLTNNQQVFFALIQAGLWEKDVQLASFDTIDLKEVYRLAEDQSVIGLVAAGLEHVVDIKLPKIEVLQFVGQALQLEQRNTAMNAFIADTVEKMNSHDINTLLVKGQGIAQCYERPLWRASGDVDFFLSQENYLKAKEYLLPLSSGNKPERSYSKELGMNIGPWFVEIHGSLRTGLSMRIDMVIDALQSEVFKKCKVRTWINGNTQVFLPAVDEDVFFVFTHFVKHFYKEGGVTLRQMCDWCRLLWMFRGNVDSQLLQSRLERAGIMNEWKAFASVAVKYLGMPIEMMPIYDKEKQWEDKARKILSFVICDYKHNIILDTFSISKIFPLNTLRFLPAIFFKVNWLKIKERILGL